MSHARIFIIALVLMMYAATGYSASSGELSVSAYITSVGVCWVNSVQDITFAPLDPFDPVNVQATGEVGVRCLGWNSNFTIGVTQMSPSPLLLTSGSSTIPYSLDFPSSVTSPVYLFGSFTIPVTARIQGDDYRFASVGTYTDIVTLQITP